MEHTCRGQRFCPFAVCSRGHARLVQQGLLFAEPSGWPIANHSCFSRMHSEVSKDICTSQEKSKNTDTLSELNHTVMWQSSEGCQISRSCRCLYYFMFVVL